MSLPFARLDATTTQALGWTLVHFLWQGALVAAALSVADVALAKAKATARYLAACLAFLAMLLAPLSTFIILQKQDRIVSSRTASITAVAPSASDDAIAAVSAIEPATGTLRTTTGVDVRSLSSFSKHLPWVVLFWTAGVVLLSLRLIGGWWLVRRLAQSSGNVELEEWQAQLRDLAHRLRVSRPVRLCRSTLVQVPTAVGWLRPLILLPASTLTGLKPAQIEAVLAHELAHIRRHDYLVNLLQSVAETLLFYHPAVWWVSRRIRDERELCCDELAMRVAGDPVSYARALYELERMRGETMSLGMAANGGSLTMRIGRLLGLPGRPWETVTRGLAGLFGAVVVLGLLMLAGLAESDGKANPSPVEHATKAAVLAAEAATDAAEAAVKAAVALLPSDATRALLAAPAADAPLLTDAPDLLEGPPLPEGPSLFEGPTPPPGLIACETMKNKDEGTPAPGEGEASAGRFSEGEWESMRQHEVTTEYARRLDGEIAGLTAGQIIAPANNGVSSKYVINVRQAGLADVTPDDLIRLAANGVSSQYIANVRAAGLEGASVEELVRLHANGVSSAFIRGIRDMDPDDMSVEDLIRLSSNGVTSKWFSAMQWMGLSEFSVEQAIQLRGAGISAEYANKLKLAMRRKLTLEELKILGVNGVPSDYVAKMYAVFPGLDVEELMKMRNQGVSTEYAQQLTIAVRDIDVDGVVQLHNQGVEPDYAYEMSRVGRFETSELIRLYQQGVSAEFLDRVLRAGYEDPSAETLIRLHQKGLPIGKEE